MKHIVLSVGLAVAALFFFGCTREAEMPVQRGTPIEVFLDLAETRTVNDGMSTQWEKGDIVSALYAPAGSTSYIPTDLTIVDPETGRATGLAELTEDAYDWYLTYPGRTWYSPQPVMYIGERYVTQNGLDNMAHLAGRYLPVFGVARNVPSMEAPAVRMKNVAAVAAVNVTNGSNRPFNVWTVKLEASRPITGGFSCDFSKDDPTYEPFSTWADNWSELTVNEGKEIPPGESATFYIPIAPVTFSAGDKLTLTVRGGVVSESFTDTREITLTDAVAFREGSIKTLKITCEPESLESAAYDPLMKLYYALDGPNWTRNDGWGTDAPLTEWAGVVLDAHTHELRLDFQNMGLKGEIPECISELPNLSFLRILNEPGVTGPWPASFGDLTDLKSLDIEKTSLDTPGDIFGRMDKLEYVLFFYNLNMTGPIPESLGASDNLTSLHLWNNNFTGSVPASWARHYKYMGLEGNRLTGEIPRTYLEGDDVSYKLHAILNQQEGYGLNIDDIDIPGYWPRGDIEDLDGKTFTFADVVSKNKYTVYLSWATWCPFSKSLMPQVADYYKKYRQDGLEIIATQMLPGSEDDASWTGVLQEQTRVVKENGYDKWYNFYFEPISWTMGYPASTPQAEVYDQDGYVVFSSFFKFPDPVRKRYGHESATIDLIPFLESVLGPAIPDDPYTSTDYSMDGEVMTLQKATVGNGINVVFMGDGYTDRDMGKDGAYEKLMRDAMEEFFALEPYKTFRNRFNVYAVKVVSPNGRIGEGYTTALGTGFGNGSETYGSQDTAYEYALRVPGIDSRDNLLVCILVNTMRSAGTAYMYESTLSSVTFSAAFGNDPQYLGPVLRHECGHGFAFLGDEYVTMQMTVPQSFIDGNNRVYADYGWNANVDFTDDPSKVRWSAFLSDERYAGKVGIYEGATLYSLGAYRPSENSMMRDNLEYFNAPSRLAIYKRIMELSGEGYSFEKFLEYDAVNRAAPLSAPRPPLKAPMRFEETPPRILP